VFSAESGSSSENESEKEEKPVSKPHSPTKVETKKEESKESGPPMVKATLLEQEKKEHGISKATIEALKQANEAAKVVHEQEKAVE
jgi:membrane-bound lytic murein transglycosylase B